jgi:hypothetical protein
MLTTLWPLFDSSLIAWELQPIKSFRGEPLVKMPPRFTTPWRNELRYELSKDAALMRCVIERNPAEMAAEIWSAAGHPKPSRWNATRRAALAILVKEAREIASDMVGEIARTKALK